MTREQINDALTGLEKGHKQFVLMTMWSNADITKHSVKMLQFSLVDDKTVQVTYVDDDYRTAKRFPLWNAVHIDSRNFAITLIRDMIMEFETEVEGKRIKSMYEEWEAQNAKICSTTND
jgi:hypothetical protein